MGDGWETKRRRGEGYDWIIVKLACLGTVARIVVDTCHFKGNYPDRVSIQAALISNPQSLDLKTDSQQWLTLLPESKLSMDKIHHFVGQLKNLGAISHIRMNIFPDGGISRLRLRGYKLGSP